MVFRQCFCDPYKLTYVSAIFTAIEAVAFGVLNIVLICMHNCTMHPPDELNLSFDWFWAWYFYDPVKCDEQEGFTPPNWLNVSYPIEPRPRITSVQANYGYQITYLILHFLWFCSAFLLIYGNGRKLWQYYLPWLTISLTLIIMDLVISSFYIADMVAVAQQGWGYRSAMFWIMAMYWRIFIFWIINLNKFGSACNAFFKTVHKRRKQSHVANVQRQAYEVEMAQAVKTAKEETHAQYRNH
ncbi:hypothetical protein Pcinc_024553 [Petrolisthes cinctipes]|uniref:Uncharacterized protein n=1 Tax=Petrolisthes cinctipes TaxID=88211 RepID=A0AAE1FCD9_PETCI|nr:hypothetical protein Pcinc_024553 [Petrolisthes cinctipes]